MTPLLDLVVEDGTTVDEALVGAQEDLMLSLKSKADENVEKSGDYSMQDIVDLMYDEKQTNSITQNVIGALGLKPFVLGFDSVGHAEDEVVALTSSSQFMRLVDYYQQGSKRLKLNLPFLQSTPNNECIHVSQSSTNALLNEVIKSSPYRQLLAFESYVPLEQDHLQVLNAHWRRRPYMFVAVSQLLAGAILIDGNQALLLNGVESYSRYPHIDAHFENFHNMKESSVPDLFSQYPNMLNIIKIPHDNSEKLELASRTAEI